MDIQEKHYTVKELAQKWGVSETWVRDHFRKEPGVLRFRADKRGHVRAYSLWRIPESVALRVYRRNMQPGKPAA